MKHLDLFSGIGGAALAVDTVWEGSEHIFCEIDPFCQQVLKKHYPTSIIHGDIRTLRLNPNPDGNGRTTRSEEIDPAERREQTFNDLKGRIDILTGGFPCQPFSQAGRRKGTEDNRFLWPEMLRVIREFKPRWVIAENVAGLLTIGGGVVFEQVCLDLEAQDYEVIPFVIPAVAVNAPHRRDRVWIVAHDRSAGLEATRPELETAGHRGKDSDDSHGNGEGWSGRRIQDEGRHRLARGDGSDERWDWGQNWLEVATRLCGVDDGLPARLDGFELTKSKHRAERLKGLGNAWVPQVAIEIMKGIKSVDN